MRRVLVVEDSPSTRAFVRAILEDESFGGPLGGLTVVEASSGFDAMRFLPRGPYDLIVTDINMGAINGLELIRFIRGSDHHKDTPLLIMSTQSTERDVERGLSLGADGFIAKPFTREALQQVVLQHLEHKTAHKTAP